MKIGNGDLTPAAEFGSPVQVFRKLACQEIVSERLGGC